MTTLEKRNEFFDNDGWLKDEYLWKLRQQIVLNSIYISDYHNNMGIPEKKVCDFFDGFMSYMEELAEEDELNKLLGKKYYDEDDLFERYDNEATLLGWYGCYDGNPFERDEYTVVVGGEYDHEIKILASDERDAEDVVDDMIRKDELSFSDEDKYADYEIIEVYLTKKYA